MTFRHALHCSVLLAPWLGLLAPIAARGATYKANPGIPDALSEGDCPTGTCSLRDAISEANANASSGPHIIKLCAMPQPPPPFYHLTLTSPGAGPEDNNEWGDLDIDADITLKCATGTARIQQTVANERVLHTMGGTDVTLDSIIVTGGDAGIAGYYGGGILAGGTLQVTGGEIVLNQAPVGGGLFAAGDVTLTGVRLWDNFADYEGGAIGNIGTLQTDGCTIDDNWAVNSGGGVWNYATASYSDSGGTFFNINHAMYGGAVHSDGTMTLDGTDFVDNWATLVAGALNLSGASTLDDANFNLNTAPKAGAIRYSGTAASGFSGTQLLDVEDTEFLENEATGPDCGGAVMTVDAAAFDCLRCDFDQNLAACGAALSSSDGDRIYIEDSTFTGNIATGDGGAWTLENTSGATASSECVGSDFVGNEAGGNGGAIYTDEAELDVDGKTVDVALFHGNTSGGDGGAIYTNEAYLVVDGWGDAVQFYGNTSGGDGGAIRSKGDLELYWVDFYDNTAGNDGGGVSHILEEGDLMEIDRVQFEENQSSSDGGGLYVHVDASSPCTATSCVGDIDNTSFVGNTAVRGGGANFDARAAAGFKLDNDLVLGNTASTNGDGLFVPDNAYAELTLNNCSILSGPEALVASGGVIDFGNTWLSSDDHCSGTVNSTGSNAGWDPSLIPGGWPGLPPPAPVCLTDTSDFVFAYPFICASPPCEFKVAHTTVVKASPLAGLADGTCTTHDQTETPRDSACDIGAYEYR